MPAALWLLALVIAIAPLEAQSGNGPDTEPAAEARAAAGGEIEKQSDELNWAHADTSGDSVADVSLPGLLLKVGLGLSFVVGLAWGSVYLLKKSALGQQFSPSASGIRILERSFLAPKRAIFLVEIGDRALALGVTEQSINVLSQWAAGELVLPERPQPTGRFAAQFRSLIDRGASSASGPESRDGDSAQPEPHT